MKKIKNNYSLKTILEMFFDGQETPLLALQAGSMDPTSYTIFTESSEEVAPGVNTNYLIITNEEEIKKAYDEGESIRIELEDALGTSQEEFLDLVTRGDIEVISTNEELVTIEGLTITPTGNHGTAAVALYWEEYNLRTFVILDNGEVKRANTLTIINKEELEEAYKNFSETEIDLSDTLGTTYMEFLSLIESGEIVIKSSNEELVKIENNQMIPNSAGLNGPVAISVEWNKYDTGDFLIMDNTPSVYPTYIRIVNNTALYSKRANQYVELIFADDIETSQDEFYRLITNGDITITIEDETIAKLYREASSLRYVLRFLKTGETIIKIEWSDYNLSQSYTIIVDENVVYFYISLDSEKIEKLIEGNYTESDYSRSTTDVYFYNVNEEDIDYLMLLNEENDKTLKDLLGVDMSEEVALYPSDFEITRENLISLYDGTSWSGSTFKELGSSSSTNYNFTYGHLRPIIFQVTFDGTTWITITNLTYNSSGSSYFSRCFANIRSVSTSEAQKDPNTDKWINTEYYIPYNNSMWSMGAVPKYRDIITNSETAPVGARIIYLRRDTDTFNLEDLPFKLKSYHSDNNHLILTITYLYSRLKPDGTINTDASMTNSLSAASSISGYIEMMISNTECLTPIFDLSDEEGE